MNYKGVEEDPDVKKTMQGSIEAGYLAPFASLEEVERYVRGKVVLTKVRAVKMVRPDRCTTTTGTTVQAQFVKILLL